MGEDIRPGYQHSGYGKETTEMNRLIAAIAVVGIVCASFLAQTASAATPVISVEPSWQKVSFGDEFTVNITIEPAENEVAGTDYILCFNNTMFNATSLVNGTFFSGFVTDNSFGEGINNTAGTIDYGEVIWPYTGTGVTTNGTLSTITFQAIGEQGVDELYFEKTTLSDPLGVKISNVSVNNGSVEIAQPTTYTIDGYIFKDGFPQHNPKVNITNLANDKEWAASIDGNFYNLTLTPGVDVNASETLQIVACEELPDHESNCNVTDITATIPGGDHNVNLTLNHYCLNYYPDYPYYTKEQDNWSGPAVMQACIGHYYDPGDVPSQAVLHETGIANNTACNDNLQYVDPMGMEETLNHNWMWPIGRNYGLYSRANSTEGLNDMLHYTCYWQHLGPAPVPAYGDYSNWMVVRGIHTSENPYPQSAGSYDIYGFWINNPNDSPESIGENTYKTVDQWTGEYYLELTGVRDCDDFRYKYVGLFEPPESPAPVVRAVPAKPRFDKTITPVMTEKTLMAYGIGQKALERTVKDDETLKIVKAAIDGVTEELIPYDTDFAAVFANTVPGKPMFVSSDNGDYYVVPFNVPVKERPQVKKRRHVAKPRPIMPTKVERTLVVVLVDAEDGSFKEASWITDPEKYLPVAKTEALKLALGELHDELHIVAKKDARDLEVIEKKPIIELVYREASPYYPDWKVTVNGKVFFVGQDGTVSCDESTNTPTLTPRPIKPGPIRILPI